MYRNPEPRFRRKALITAIVCASLSGMAAAQENEPTALDALDVTAPRSQVTSESTGSYISGTTTSS
ncbi:MAG TPA: hypothetical protein VK006_11130, partial [Marinobacter sp.]|nr:hypothetical protein [Marinobacter sp.]